METSRITRHLNRLFLDPNNYRFIDKSDYKVVPDDQIKDLRVQQRTFNLLAGKNNENILDLIVSFKTNGFLEIDQIQVREIEKDYVVLEGNRRIATLKYLFEQFKQGNDVGVLREESFKSIQVVVISNERPVEHLITMGLHHITGKKRWTPINQAQLVQDLMEKHSLSESEICNSLGITKQMLRRSIRTLALIEQYKQSDFGDQFQTNMYSFFEEVIRSNPMKEWIEWNDGNYCAENINNLMRFFSWISKSEEIERDETLPSSELQEGSDDIEERHNYYEPIITQSRQIRELAEFISDEKAIKIMENRRSISQGYSFSDAVGITQLRNSLNNIRNDVQTVFNRSELMNQEDFELVGILKNKLDSLIPATIAQLLIAKRKANSFFESVSNHFSNINIAKYRALKDIEITNTSKINIFAGNNNSGKTSVLEAIYLLSQLNELNSFLDLEKYRGKYLDVFPSVWLDAGIIDNILVRGSFNDINCSLEIGKEDTNEDTEKAGYLSTITQIATVDNSSYTSTLNLFVDREPEMHYGKVAILCPAAFTSPYRYNSKLLETAYSQAVTEKYIDKIVTFLARNIDNSIVNITLTLTDGVSRFLVNTTHLEKAIDITKYGEGLQRVFEIALLMGYCKNGILCIDEIESAIHKTLLNEFTGFLIKSAHEYNVQVFVSTHSKECIDAFMLCESSATDITAYSLKRSEDEITCKYIDGKRLSRMIENIDLDIR